MGGNRPGQFVYGYWGLKDNKAANIKLSRPRPSKLLSGAHCVLGKMHCTGLSYDTLHSIFVRYKVEHIIVPGINSTRTIQ